MAQVQFATWNPADASGALIYSDGNRSIAGNGSTRFWARSTLPSRGRAFFSVVAGNVGSQGIGIAAAGDLGSFMGQNGLSVALWPAGFVVQNAVQTELAALAFASGDVIDVAHDRGADLIWFRVDGGPWNGDAAADPATGIGGIACPLPAGPVYAAIDAAGTEHATANFGASVYAHAPPAGFQNLCVIGGLLDLATARRLWFGGTELAALWLGEDRVWEYRFPDFSSPLSAASLAENGLPHLFPADALHAAELVTEPEAIGGSTLALRPGTTAGARVFYALEDRFADPDQEALVKARIGQLSGLTSGVLLSLNLRLVKAGSDFAGYRFDARMPTDGAATVGFEIRRWTGSGEASTALESSAGLSDHYGAWFWLRVRVTGTTLRARYWLDGVAEPATWPLEVTDTTYAAPGGFALASMMPDANHYADLDFLSVVDEGATAPGSTLAPPPPNIAFPDQLMTFNGGAYDPYHLARMHANRGGSGTPAVLDDPVGSFRPTAESLVLWSGSTTTRRLSTDNDLYRPVLKHFDGRNCLQFDGVDDYLWSYIIGCRLSETKAFTFAAMVWTDDTSAGSPFGANRGEVSGTRVLIIPHEVNYAAGAGFARFSASTPPRWSMPTTPTAIRPSRAGS